MRISRPRNESAKVARAKQARLLSQPVETLSAATERRPKKWKRPHQSAHTITAALVTIGAIEIVAKGKAGSNSRKPAEFRYLQSEGDNGAQADHDGEVQI